MLENGNKKSPNTTEVLGISFPKTISIGVIIVSVMQGSSFIWQVSKYSSTMDKLSEQIQQTNNDLAKIKSDIYTRQEAMIQFDSIKKEMDIRDKNVERLEYDVRELQKRIMK